VAPDLPSYDDLPIRPDLPAGSAWGVWGDDDPLGCLNLLTTERTLRGLGLAPRGAVFALNLEAELPSPPLFNRSAFEHRINGLGSPVSRDDELHAWNTQSSSQWDSLRHVRSPHGFWNNLDETALGIHHFARKGIVCRAVLADVARWREAQGRPLRPDAADPIEPDDVTATLEAQGVEIEQGDVLLIRTGWVAWYRTLDQAARTALAGSLQAPGLRPGRPTAQLLWDLHIAAVAADNPSLEVWPPGALSSSEERSAIRADPERGLELFVHLALLPLLGLPIGELWDLDALAADCASDGVYEFLFTSAPLNLQSGVASPPNALAVK